MTNLHEAAPQARWRPYVGLAAFAVLSALMHPKWNMSVAGWFAVVPLLLVLRGVQTWKRALWYGWFGGFLAFLNIIGWLYKVGVYSGVGPPFGVVVGFAGAVILSAYLGVFIALFGVLVVTTLPRRGYRYVFGVAVHWALCEWLRGWMLTGFPWGALGYSQWNNLVVAQLAALGGVPLISFALAIVNATVALTLASRPSWKRMATLGAPAFATLLLTTTYGMIALNDDQATSESIRFAVVPGNIPQDVRWRGNALRENFDLYMNLMEKAAAERPDVIALPETAILLQHLGDEERKRFRQFAIDRQATLLFGTARIVADSSGNRVSYNAAMTINPQGDVTGKYDKQHLVPFGEYIPFRNLLPSFLVEKIIGVGDHEFGKEANLLEVASIKVGAPICFESVFPDISREFTNNGADLLAVITNDGWYDDTAAIPQHNVFAVFRAIENRRPLVRAANRGISGFIDAHGRISKNRVSADDQSAIIVEDVALYRGASLYTKWGDWPSALAVLATLAWIVRATMRQRKGEKGNDRHGE